MNYSLEPVSLIVPKCGIDPASPPVIDFGRAQFSYAFTVFTEVNRSIRDIADDMMLI